MSFNQLNAEESKAVIEYISKSHPDVLKEAIIYISGIPDDSCNHLECGSSQFPLPPEKRSIKLSQLNKIAVDARKKFGSERYEKMTMRDIVEEVIKPQCKITGQPYALHLNPEGLKMETFCTHCWDEQYDDFLNSINQAYEGNLNPPNLWICAFALFQGTKEDIAEQISGKEAFKLSDSPFVRALRNANEFLVIRNSSVDLYSRIWCVCELLYAWEFKFVPDNTKVAGPDSFRDESTSIKDAKAFDQNDRDRILGYLMQEHGCEEIDNIVAEIRAHTLTMKKGINAKSQKEVADRFIDILSKRNEKYRKIASSFIRKGVKGETITTVLFGQKETEITIQDDDSYVVCGPAAFETYRISNEEFYKNYDVDYPNEIGTSLPPYQRLRELGFKEYNSKRVVLAHKIDLDDMQWFRSGTCNNLPDDENEPVCFFAPVSISLFTLCAKHLLLFFITKFSNYWK